MNAHWIIRHYDSVNSTQDIARENLKPYTLIQAKAQSAGKGRHGRGWVSQKGNLFFSFVFNPDCAPSEYGQVALKTGLALGKAIEEISGKKAMLKWPNDILMEGQKCAGILIETEKNNLIIGIGVNTQMAPSGACALSINDNNALRDAFCAHFDKLIPMNFLDVRQQWLSMAHKEGTTMSVKIGDDIRTGAFETIDEKGSLIIDGQIINAGEVIL